MADRFLFFKHYSYLIHKMAPKMSIKNMRKMQVHTVTPEEFEMGDTASDIEKRRVEKEQRVRVEAEKQQWEEMEGGSHEVGEYSTGGYLTDGGVVAEKRHRTGKSESEMETKGGRGANQTATDCLSSHKKGKMANIYVTD